MLFKFKSAIFGIGKYEREIAMDLSTFDSSCFNGAYKEFVELIGHKNTLLVHEYFSGQYVTFPKRLLSEAYLHQQILAEYDGDNAKKLARKYGYSYSWVRKILKNQEDVNCEKYRVK